MKLSNLFALFILSLSINATFWLPILRPFVLTLGTAFTALNLDVEPIIDGMKNIVFSEKENVYENETEIEKKRKKEDKIAADKFFELQEAYNKRWEERIKREKENPKKEVPLDTDDLTPEELA